MPLHPIIALDHIIEEYRDHLLTEFRAKDDALRAALDRELEQPLFLAQEPFYQAHRPFRAGLKWRELPLDAKLAGVMEARALKHGSPTAEFAYSHQSDGIAELLRPEARPVVVTTGTGSGKTEAFLLPVIQNAIEDAARFKKSGLTAILVYPLNALAEDQRNRIRDYLKESGFSDSVKVAQYNRGTKQEDREAMRRNPPHILLTNYMMLEYLLVRPADREAIFANHRCRFVVLDEVHTYRGSLGSNIALLIRRLRAHLQKAAQDWLPDPPEADRARRFPKLVPVGTSATIKSVSVEGLPPEEAKRLRNVAVQEFFSRLTGEAPSTIQVFGEAIKDLTIPADAVYAPAPSGKIIVIISDPESIRQAFCRLSGLPADTSVQEAARRCRLLWDVNRWLITAPLSLSQMAERVRQEVAPRRDVSEEAIRQELEAVLIAGAALPETVPGVLKLRAHRFIRGGWYFHRCLNPACGKLYPMGQQQCECGHRTAPLHLCRNCGADFLQLAGDLENGMLRLPSGNPEDDKPEMMLFDPARYEIVDDGEEENDPEEAGDEKPSRRPRAAAAPSARKKFQLGSFSPSLLAFSTDEKEYSSKAGLIQGRRLCPCCGGRAGARSVITPVQMGTSAALKVLAEGVVEALDDAHAGESGTDGKNRLLIFSDSRQDASHQARFIIFASRYDRMRRNVFRILREHGTISLQRTVELLGVEGLRDRDNPNAEDFQPDQWLSEEAKKRIQSYEEAPLLDNISVGAGYRATIINLGLTGIQYHELKEYVTAAGRPLSTSLGITQDQLWHLCRCFLDMALYQGALSRERLRYHPRNIACPAYFVRAEWERAMPWPKGLPCDAQGHPTVRVEAQEIPGGMTVRPVWRAGGKGAQPAFEKMIRRLQAAFGGRSELNPEDALALMEFLVKGQFLVSSKLFGIRESRQLLQVNDERVWLEPLTEKSRMRCSVCSSPRSGSPEGAPCPRCHGRLVPWKDIEVDRLRMVKRTKAERFLPLYAGEHTAQVTAERRVKLEEEFKAPMAESRRNLLACSPTLEMGIDVGGLEAVAMRNIPPRPDNYAQRGGRAGRRARVGIVLGYAGRTPHDQYFFDKPEEMIAGEIPAPALALTNRDVILRHVFAIAFGAAEPGLAGRMAAYVTAEGKVQEEAVKTLITGIADKTPYALDMARLAFGEDVLTAANLPEPALREALEKLGGRIRDIIDRTAKQVSDLRQALERYYHTLQDRAQGNRAADLVGRLLGIPTERRGGDEQADDRSGGYPLRRFAEAGLLPGYEFPIEPASLRLMGDPNEEEAVTVARPFGIGQFQPDSPVFARTKRWRVCGLDQSSPWNPRTDAPGLTYRVCRNCHLRFDAQRPACPRCRDEQMNQTLSGYAFGGFLAKREESPVLNEEDRIPGRNTVRLYPQWDGEAVGRWSLSCGWPITLWRNERVFWLNEGRSPSIGELEKDVARLHNEGKGFLLCGSCGSILTIPDKKNAEKGRKKVAKGKEDPCGHRVGCQKAGQPPSPIAIYTEGATEILRLIVPIPPDMKPDQHRSWGLSLGYALRTGMRQFYMLDGTEIEFELEGPWTRKVDGQTACYVGLSFIDPSLGGTGYLTKAAGDFDQIAQRAIEHLRHADCEKACYRCLKTYANQRVHELLNWPLAINTLEALAADKPTAVKLELGDTHDPRPWLEAYAAGVGSPLELKFLRLFEQNGFHPAKQVEIAVPDGSTPITIADFAVPERRLAIYVDGASIHLGHVARRDRLIRSRLQKATPPWRVVELRAADLGKGAVLVESLKKG